jgi:cation diffusion facilitator family transporter
MACNTADFNQIDLEHRDQANRALALSAIGLGLTGSIELLLALGTGSVALLGDALHNLSDVSTSALVFLGFKLSKRPPTRKYPYGFERAEDLAGLGVAFVIWASAVFAGYESYQKLIQKAPTNQPWLGIAGALLGIIGNRVVAGYKMKVGERIRSITLIADAKHSWLDALSSLGALIGLALVATGYQWGDPIAGFAVTIFIVHVGYTVTVEIVEHLMDSVEPDDLVAAESAAAAVAGVRGAAARARWTGRSLIIEIEGTLQEDASLKEAEAIGHEVKHAVLNTLGSARQVQWMPRCGLEQHEIKQS